ncbi:MAG: cytochrome PufQ [Pseudomonadota bacterium]
MADITSNVPTRHHAKRSDRGTEFYIYFTLIFILAIPVGVERYLAAIIRKRSLDVRGPIARAWAEADRITPLIFSAR